MRALIAVLCLAALTGCASLTPKENAQLALGADVGVTAGAILSHVASEGNPLALVGLPLTWAATEYADKLPREDGLPILHGITAARWGAAAWGVCVALSGGLCAVPGVGVAAYLWNDGADEREFWRMCAYHRRERPELVCHWKPPT